MKVSRQHRQLMAEHARARRPPAPPARQQSSKRHATARTTIVGHHSAPAKPALKAVPPDGMTKTSFLSMPQYQPASITPRDERPPG